MYKQATFYIIRTQSPNLIGFTLGVVCFGCMFFNSMITSTSVSKSTKPNIEITLALLTWVTPLMYSACAHYVFERITFQSRYMRSMPAALPSHFGRGSGLVTGLTLALRIFGDAKA